MGKGLVPGTARVCPGWARLPRDVSICLGIVSSIGTVGKGESLCLVKGPTCLGRAVGSAWQIKARVVSVGD